MMWREVFNTFCTFICMCAAQKFSETCSKITFKRSGSGISKALSRLIENNIFVKLPLMRNEFPVYKAENRPLYFFYISKEKKFIFSRSCRNEFDISTVSDNKYIIFDKTWQSGVKDSMLQSDRNVFAGVKNLRPICLSPGSNVIRKKRDAWRDPYDTSDPKFDADHDGFFEAAIAIGCILPFVFPLAHWCFKKTRKSENDEDEFISSSCCRTFSFHFYIGFILWCIFLIVGSVIHIQQYGRRTFYVLFIIAYCMLGLSVLVVWCESCFSREANSLSKKFDTNEASNLIHKLLETWPTVTVHIACWHNEKRTRRVRHKDSRGNTHYRTETYYVRVDTFKDQCAFQYHHCKDISDIESMPEIGAKGVTFMKLRMNISLANQETVDALEALKNEMIEQNKHRDEHIDCGVKEEVDGFREHFSIGDPEKGIPWWMDNGYFALFSIIWCSWPYRFILRKSTNRKEFSYHKDISVTPECITNQMMPTIPIIGDPSTGNEMTPSASAPNWNAQYNAPAGGVQYNPPLGGVQYNPPPGGIQYNPPPAGVQYNPPPGGFQYNPPPGGAQYNPPPPYNAQSGGGQYIPGSGGRIPLSSIAMYTSCNPEDAPPSYESLQIEK